MTRKQIINSALKTLNTELKGIKTLSKTFNNNFYNAVNTIFYIKGRVIVTGVGKSAHIGNKISELSPLLELLQFLFIQQKQVMGTWEASERMIVFLQSLIRVKLQNFYIL